MRGAIQQVASLVGIVIAFVAASYLYLRLLPLVRRFLPSVPYPEMISYLTIFVFAWLIIIFVSLLLARLSRVMLMGWADRLLGGILGLLNGTVAALVLVSAITLFSSGNSPLLTGSLLATHVQRAGYYFMQLTPEDLRQDFQEKYNTLVRQLNRQEITRNIEKTSKR